MSQKWSAAQYPRTHSPSTATSSSSDRTATRLSAQRIIGASGVAERDPDGADYTSDPLSASSNDLEKDSRPRRDVDPDGISATRPPPRRAASSFSSGREIY